MISHAGLLFTHLISCKTFQIKQLLILFWNTVWHIRAGKCIKTGFVDACHYVSGFLYCHTETVVFIFNNQSALWMMCLTVNSRFNSRISLKALFSQHIIISLSLIQFGKLTSIWIMFSLVCLNLKISWHQWTAFAEQIIYGAFLQLQPTVSPKSDDVC